VKIILLGIISTLSFAALLAAQAQKSPAASDQSLGDLARKLRAEHDTQSAKPARTFTNENVPHHGGISIIGPPPVGPSEEEPPKSSRKRAVERAVKPRLEFAERDTPCVEAAPPSGSWQIPDTSQVAVDPWEVGERAEHPRRTREERSQAAKDAFKRACPCPATETTTGACPGYVIDHIKPLACGGPDAPNNMAWQTVADSKTKDKWERKQCTN
jgi:hypothetical protein